MEDNHINEEIHEDVVNDDESQTLNLEKLEDKISLVFDYEINNAILEANDESTLLYYDEKEKQNKPIDYNLYYDKLRPVPKLKPSKDPKKSKYNTSIYDNEFEEIEKDEGDADKLKKANFMKRLVSKQKRRFQDTNFDLDMSYITERVIAMGFPSTGLEMMYRNSLSDILKFFHVRHEDQVKVYNLCLEKERIYNKNIFPNIEVGLFPATDHNPSPIKLILECCIDICLYLLKHPNGVAAVHCKAGKGRTGVMICSYLIFSGLCQSSEKAFRYYARVRTKNNTGVTIPSQKRYIKYFETFLQANFYRPYIKLIPKIIRSHFSFLINETNTIKINNILESFQREKSYFISPNKFKLKGIKLGPLSKGKELKVKICNFIDSKFEIPKKNLTESKESELDGTKFYELYFNPELIVYSDIKIKIKKDVNFYIWVNLWHETWKKIKEIYDKRTNRKGTTCSESDLTANLIQGPKGDNSRGSVPKGSTPSLEDKEKDNNDEESFGNIKRVSVNPLSDIIYKLKHNTDLNELINEMNSKLDLSIDRENMEIKLYSYEFDKFHEIKQFSNLEMSIYYSLCDNNSN